MAGYMQGVALDCPLTSRSQCCQHKKPYAISMFILFCLIKTASSQDLQQSTLQA